VAGLTEDAVRKAMKDNTAARDFYASELKALMHCEGEGGSRADRGARRPECCGPRCRRSHAAGGKRPNAGRQRHAAGARLCNPDCGCPTHSPGGRCE
jgi:hypothetical protein